MEVIESLRRSLQLVAFCELQRNMCTKIYLFDVPVLMMIRFFKADQYRMRYRPSLFFSYRSVQDWNFKRFAEKKGVFRSPENWLHARYQIVCAAGCHTMVTHIADLASLVAHPAYGRLSKRICRMKAEGLPAVSGVDLTCVPDFLLRSMPLIRRYDKIRALLIKPAEILPAVV